MKKIITAVLALALGCTAFAACTDNTGNETNEKPVITGFQDTYTVQAGEEFNALEGVTASDKEDGDLTDKITVSSMPEVTFTDGKATFEQTGTYEIIFGVTDSANQLTEEFATLTVTKADAVETLYHTFDFSVSTAEVDRDGWDVALAGGAAAEVKTERGLLSAEITNGGTINGDVILQKTDFAVEEGVTYDVRLYIGATLTEAKYVDTAVQNAAGANIIYQGANLTDSIQIVSLSFKATEDASDYKIVVHCGGGAGEYSVYMEKVEIYKSSGVESTTEILSQNFDGADASGLLQKYPYDQGTEFSVTDGAMQVNILSYPEAVGNIWERGVMLSTGLDLEESTSYRFIADVTAQTAQEFVGKFVASSGEDATESGRFQGTFEQGTHTVTYDFTTGAAREDAYLAFQLGFQPAGTASNALTFDNIRILKITSVADVEKDMVRFMPYNSDTGYDVFNGSDDASGKLDGTGRIYTDGEAMHFIISNKGGADYYNKMMFYIDLEELANYRFSFKAKANVDLSCFMFVNVKGGSYSPIGTYGANITTQEQEFTFTAEQMVMLDNSYEITVQNVVPSEAGYNGMIEIEFYDFEVYKIA